MFFTDSFFTDSFIADSHVAESHVATSVINNRCDECGIGRLLAERLLIGRLLNQAGVMAKQALDCLRLRQRINTKTMDPLAAQQQQPATIISGVGGFDLSSENVLTGRGRLERRGVHGSGQLAVEQGSDQQKQAGGEDHKDA